MFSTHVRYSGASLGYQFGAIFGGALAPIIATQLLATYGTTIGVSWYIAAACVITLVSVSMLRETRGTDLHAAHPSRASQRMIEIVDYRASWPQDFRDIARVIRSGLGDVALRIDHIGSTSVPGLCAKDVIDLQISVAALDAQVTVAMHGSATRRRRTSHATIDRPTTTARTQIGSSCTFARRPANAERIHTFGYSADRTSDTRCCFATI